MIQQFRNVHKDRTCVIVGNGPSLDTSPIEALSEKYMTFSANKIYECAAHPDFKPMFWTCIDDLMLTDCIPWLIEHRDFAPNKFVPRYVPLPGSYGLNTVVDIGFSTDAAEKVFLGGTVTYVNMQLAYYMGFETVLLVGLDHKYPKSAAQGKPGSRMISDGNDPDHFKTKGGAYFSSGRMYSRPELDATERHFFPLAKQAFKGKIYNLTPNSAEKVFEKQDFSKWL